MIMLNNLLQIHLKFLQKGSLKKVAEAAGDLIGNKITDQITRVSKTSPKDNSETNEEQIPLKVYKKKYIKNIC